MSATHQLGLVYGDLRALRQKILDLDPMLPPGLTVRQLLHDLDDVEETLGSLVLRSAERLPNPCA